MRGLCPECQTMHHSYEPCADTYLNARIRENHNEREGVLKKVRKTTIEKAANELENMLEANRKYHTTKAPWEKRK